MAFFRSDLRGGAFRSVLGFTWLHWQRQPVRIVVIAGAVLLSTLADVLTPLYSGRLVDAVVNGHATEAVVWDAAIAAFSTLLALSLGAIVLRHITFMQIVDLTLNMMTEIASGLSTASSVSRPIGMPTASQVRPFAR